MCKSNNNIRNNNDFTCEFFCSILFYHLKADDSMVQNNDVSFSLFKQLALNVAVRVCRSRKLVKSSPNPTRISDSIERMVQMLLILSISDARNSHRLTLLMSPWM